MKFDTEQMRRFETLIARPDTLVTLSDALENFAVLGIQPESFVSLLEFQASIADSFVAIADKLASEPRYSDRDYLLSEMARCAGGSISLLTARTPFAHGWPEAILAADKIGQAFCAMFLTSSTVAPIRATQKSAA
jgi:hypothetical protein